MVTFTLTSWKNNEYMIDCIIMDQSTYENESKRSPFIHILGLRFHRPAIDLETFQNHQSGP